MHDRLRVSDADRDRAMASLRDHFAAARLTMQELEERLAAALGAATFGDLRRVLAGLPETAPAMQQVSFGSPQAGQLARGYRRLLACFPVWYRMVHEEEMLAVLMTTAPPGKRRPSIAEAADLLWGALRIRCQPARTGGEPAWRDALAVASVIVPLILVVSWVVNETPLFLPGSGALAHGFRLWALKALAAPLAMGALVPLALRMQRLAALAGAGLLTWLVSLPGHAVSIAIGEAPVILAAGLLTIALAASQGPRRGLQILTWKHAAVVLIATMLVCTSVIPVGPARPVVRLIVIGVIGVGMTLASSLGRWLLLLLAIPAYPLLFFLEAPFFAPGFGIALTLPDQLAACYLPPLTLLFLAALAARRASSRRSKPLGTPDA